MKNDRFSKCHLPSGYDTQSASCQRAVQTVSDFLEKMKSSLLALIISTKTNNTDRETEAKPESPQEPEQSCSQAGGEEGLLVFFVWLLVRNCLGQK